MRIMTLLIAWVGLAALAVPGQARSLLFTVEGLDGIDVAVREGDEPVVLPEVLEDDGIFSFTGDFDLDPAADKTQTVIVHIDSGPAFSHFIFVTFRYPVIEQMDEDPPLVYPFFITGTEDRIITLLPEPPEMRFVLGQEVDVVEGLIHGLDALVYVSPGTGSARELMDVDLNDLTLYSGPLTVGGRMTIVPEPAGALLLALGACAAAIRRARPRAS